MSEQITETPAAPEAPAAPAAPVEAPRSPREAIDHYARQAREISTGLEPEPAAAPDEAAPAVEGEPSDEWLAGYNEAVQALQAEPEPPKPGDDGYREYVEAEIADLREQNVELTREIAAQFGVEPEQIEALLQQRDAQRQEQLLAGQRDAVEFARTFIGDVAQEHFASLPGGEEATLPAAEVDAILELSRAVYGQVAAEHGPEAAAALSQQIMRESVATHLDHLRQGSDRLYELVSIGGKLNRDFDPVDAIDTATSVFADAVEQGLDEQAAVLAAAQVASREAAGPQNDPGAPGRLTEYYTARATQIHEADRPPVVKPATFETPEQVSDYYASRARELAKEA